MIGLFIKSGPGMVLGVDVLAPHCGACAGNWKLAFRAHDFRQQAACGTYQLMTGSKKLSVTRPPALSECLKRSPIRIDVMTHTRDCHSKLNCHHSLLSAFVREAEEFVAHLGEIERSNCV
jgi:hypothetical protein